MVRCKRRKIGLGDRVEGPSSAKKKGNKIIENKFPSTFFFFFFLESIILANFSLVRWETILSRKFKEELTRFNSSNKGREISTFFLGISFMATVEFCGELHYVHVCIMEEKKG